MAAEKEFHLSVAKDFSPTPGWRYDIQSGQLSGESFRRKKVYPMFKQAIDEDGLLVVDLNGVKHGYANSFLSEAFAGLVFCYDEFNPEDVLNHLVLIYDMEWKVDWVKSEIRKAIRAEKMQPVATI